MGNCYYKNAMASKCNTTSVLYANMLDKTQSHIADEDPTHLDIRNKYHLLYPIPSLPPHILILTISFPIPYLQKL